MAMLWYAQGLILAVVMGVEVISGDMMRQCRQVGVFGYLMGVRECGSLGVDVFGKAGGE